ncbi:MAG: sulfatase-like hydrolase/transferase, partial [Oscillospiraceae bacterium]|nr:sulfatase-like hydrolase/transferase [Oscillospiraceae bacterium]
ISSDSTNQKFGDGSNPLLNRFYDSDFQFNEFMNKFNDSKLADNTLIVFTTNQAAYAEREFAKAFPDCIREAPDVDEIPFFMYYKGIQPQVIDAAGRNSLDFASTVLDYIDVAEPNYFLGETMFYSKENNTNYDTIFWDCSELLSTDDGIITDISENERLLFMDQMREYFNAMKYDPGKDDQ